MPACVLSLLVVFRCAGPREEPDLHATLLARARRGSHKSKCRLRLKKKELLETSRTEVLLHGVSVPRISYKYGQVPLLCATGTWYTYSCLVYCCTSSGCISEQCTLSVYSVICQVWYERPVAPTAISHQCWPADCWLSPNSFYVLTTYWKKSCLAIFIYIYMLVYILRSMSVLVDGSQYKYERANERFVLRGWPWYY